MILSHLSTRDLTRALTVSKHWRDVMLDPKSKELRRILFLEPSEATEYLEYRTAFRRKYYMSICNSFPVIVHEPSKKSKLVVEVHPILLPYCDRDNTTRVSVWSMYRDYIRSVPPPTYLFQPPLDEVFLYDIPRGAPSIIRAEGGVTFGALLEELATWDPRKPFYISSIGVVATVVKHVQIARTAQAMEQLSAEKETMQPEVFQYSRSRVLEGRPAVFEAEFERLRILGIVGPTTTEELDELLDSSELRLTWD